jgi:hypothetical protein
MNFTTPTDRQRRCRKAMIDNNGRSNSQVFRLATYYSFSDCGVT